MLSVDNSLKDMQAELQSYNALGFDTPAEFDAACTSALDKAKREYMIPIMSQTRWGTDFQITAGGFYNTAEYDAVAAKNKIGFLQWEEYVYYAEIYFALSLFGEGEEVKEKFRRKGNTESRSEGGQTISITSGFGGKGAFSLHWLQKARSYMVKAGYELATSLSPGRSIHAT